MALQSEGMHKLHKDGRSPFLPATLGKESTPIHSTGWGLMLRDCDRGGNFSCLSGPALKGLANAGDSERPLVKFDCAGDADDLPLEHGDPLVGLHFRPNRNEPGERLIGVFSSEADTCSPERAYGNRDKQAAHFDIFTNVPNDCRIFDHRQFVCTYYS